MMRVVTLNVNGIRAAERKGFFTWLQEIDADIVCLQETKAQEWQLTKAVFCPAGYHCYYHDAEKKGYSGVALYSKIEPNVVKSGLGWPVADIEGRYIEAKFNNLIVASLYLPSGTSGDVRQALKYEFMDKYLPYLRQLRDQGECIICGDRNIAHKKMDIKNWRGNQKHSGFLPEERAWLDQLFDEEGFVDAFRAVNNEPDYYTWWSNRGQAWAKNVGWRIDYQVVTPGLRERIKCVQIYKAQRFSDHAPLIVDYFVNEY